MKSTVSIIDYGMGNLHSAAKALELVSDAKVIVSSKPEEILSADHVVFPGVGAIRDCVGEIKRLGLDEVVLEAAKTKPVLGICVGMQALMSRSAENNGVDCLGFFPEQVDFFSDSITDSALKVPHMGWNQVYQSEHALWAGIPDGARFYFVHSYYVPFSDDNSEVIGRTNYGHDFTAAVCKDNVAAVQFHPEKSAEHGLQLLRNFVQWDGQS